MAFGQDGIFLEQNSIVHSGDVGENISTGGPYLSDSEEAVIGVNVTLDLSSSRVVGDSILVKNKAQVYDVFYNDITENGTVSGNHYTPLSLPVFSSMPSVPSFTPGSTPETADTTLTLPAGDYGLLTANNSSAVTFEGGVYTFTSWDIKQNVNLYFSAPSEIRIAEKLSTEQGTYIGPGGTCSPCPGARDILIIVTGINGTTGAIGATPKAIDIGQNNTLVANVYAPNGTLNLKQGTVATGAFLARWVDVGPNVELTLASGY